MLKGSAVLDGTLLPSGASGGMEGTSVVLPRGEIPPLAQKGMGARRRGVNANRDGQSPTSSTTTFSDAAISASDQSGFFAELGRDLAHSPVGSGRPILEGSSDEFLDALRSDGLLERFANEGALNATTASASATSAEGAVSNAQEAPKVYLGDRILNIFNLIARNIPEASYFDLSANSSAIVFLLKIVSLPEYGAIMMRSIGMGVTAGVATMFCLNDFNISKGLFAASTAMMLSASVLMGESATGAAVLGVISGIKLCELLLGCRQAQGKAEVEMIAR